jgi:fructose-1-phosphate kinase PfkB-like protein
MIQIIQAAGGKALVDADGENLRQACAAAPYLVKPNALEASRYFGMEVGSIELAVVAARRFHGSGVRLAMITLGAEGAVLSDGENTWLATPPVISVGSAIGAGDASLAGFVWGISRGVSLPEALRLGVASGTAAASLPGTAVADRVLLEQVASQVVVVTI